MNTRYCPACAARNEYTITKPTTCGECGCNLDKAFASAAIAISAPVAAPAPTRHLTRAATPIAPRRRRPLKDDQEYDPEDDYNQDEVEVLASEMAQEVEGADLFSMGIETEYRPIKLGSLENVRETATKRAQEPAAPKRKSRK